MGRLRWHWAGVTGVLALLTLPSCLRALEVRIADVGRTSFIDDMQDSKYVIALRTHREVASLGPDADAGCTPVVMSDKLGSKYKCFLPPVGGEGGSGEGREEESGGMGGASSKPPSLYLNGLTSTCFYRVEGWWTYELCYKKTIRQYHQDQDKISSEFVLGKFDEVASEELEMKVTEGDAAGAGYFSQRYSDGTPCDITGTPRETEVRYVCSSDAASVISSIKEPSTCSYVVMFQTPLLCKHPSFRKKTVTATPIYCNPLSSPPEDAEESSTSAPEEEEDSVSDSEEPRTFESNGNNYKLTYVDGKAHVQIIPPEVSGGDGAENDGRRPLGVPPGGPSREGGESSRANEQVAEDSYESEDGTSGSFEVSADDYNDAQPPAGHDEL